MSLAPMRFPNPRAKYRLKNVTRFVAALLVFLLAVTAVFVILAKNKDNTGNTDQTAVVVTPVATPTPTPEPTPEPIEIPEGKTMEPVLVVIDAGHGGRDGGTISPYIDGFYEKDITLDIAKRVEKYLAEKGIDVIMTRDTDMQFSTVNREDLIARADVANSNNASLFVSIHVNAYDLKYKGAAQVNGMEVYYYEKPATYENFTDERFAQIVGDEIIKANGINFNGVKSNNYSVLRNTVMPAILIETGYITNKDDHERLRSDEFREKTAQGIAEGISLTLQEINAFEYDGDLYVFKEIRE